MKWWQIRARKKRRGRRVEEDVLVIKEALGKALDLVGELKGKVEDVAEASPKLEQEIKRSRELYEMARKDLGLAEVPGKGNNPRILEIIRKALPDAEDDSTIAWCGIVVGEWVRSLGLTPPKGYPGARRWLDFGKKVLDPQVGDVVVMWRESPQSWKGHVGLYAGARGDQVKVLGGNQSNRVSEAWYPKERVLGYRRPV